LVTDNVYSSFILEPTEKPQKGVTGGFITKHRPHYLKAGLVSIPGLQGPEGNEHLACIQGNTVLPKCTTSALAKPVVSANAIMYQRVTY